MTAEDTRQVPVYCYQCVAGPDLLKVEVADGVATRVEGNFDIAREHPGGGRICVKAYGLVQKTYNPNRVRQPMKRTNPRKGRGEDPGFVPISWDEALDAVAARLRGIREKGLRDESGYPRVAASFGGGGTPTQYMGTFPAFLSAWGPVDLGYGSGQGMKCYHSEHLYGELWHRAFIVSPDTPRTEYVISCGHNVEASGGVAGVWRQADARARGLKRVQVEPHLSVTGAVSAEWVPIKPKTDAAFLYALVHCILHEHDWRRVCDVRFLAEDTSAPYLVGPNGYYLRERATGKPLILDLADGRAKPFDAAIAEPALDGAYRVAGVEIGADEERWEHDGVEAKPSFRLLIEHMAGYSPDWAAGECDIPAERIRRIAAEYLAHARVGETVEIEGRTLPLRPVAVMLGKTVNNGWGGYECCWARTLLACLVGALEVPGGLLGTNVKLVRPADDRLKSVRRDGDGLMAHPFNETSRAGWQRDPHIRNAYRTLVPLAADSPWSPALGPAHLPWLFHKEPPDNWPAPTKPEIWFCYRTNPAISQLAAPEVAQRVAEFPFVVAFAYTRDETNHMADILLPEATDLEGLQLIRIGGTKFIENFWRHHGWAIRQPVADRVVDSRDMTDIATELAARVGLLDAYNRAINRGAAGMKLDGEGFDYALDPDLAAWLRGHLGPRVQGGEPRAQRRRRGARPRLVQGERVHAGAAGRAVLVPLSQGQGRGRALRAALPGAHQAARHPARAQAARDRRHLVGPAARGVPAPAALQALPRHLDRPCARGRPRSRRVPFLGADRAQHAVFVGRQRRRAGDPRGRRQRRRPPRHHRQPRRRRAASASPRATS